MGGKTGEVLEVVIVLLVLLPLALEAVSPVTVVSAPLAIVADIEAWVHLGQGIHAQDLVDLPECQQPQSKLGT